jgi:hypothetical protein
VEKKMSLLVFQHKEGGETMKQHLGKDDKLSNSNLICKGKGDDLLLLHIND